MSWDELRKKQPKVAKILMNSIKNNRLLHAYLFEGAKGTGKKEMALYLAKSYFCKERVDEHPCEVCSDCKRIDSLNHPDLHLISPDGQSIKKEQVIYLQKEFTYLGMESRKKFYIVEQADKMTQQAANSLLKFLEEPKSPTVAVLITNAKRNMLKTIESRTQVLSFAELPIAQFKERLMKENIPSSVAHLLATLTTNIDEANKLYQDNWIVQARNVVLQLTEEVYQRPQQVLLTLQEKYLPHFNGRDLLEIGLDIFLLWYRDLLYIQLNNRDEIIFIDQMERLEREAFRFSETKLVEQMTAVLEAKKHVRANVNAQLLMERLLLNLQEG